MNDVGKTHEDLERFLAYDLSAGASTRVARELLREAATGPKRGAVAL